MKLIYALAFCFVLLSITNQQLQCMQAVGRQARKKPASRPTTQPKIPAPTPASEPALKPIAYKKQKLASLITTFNTLFIGLLDDTTNNNLRTTVENEPIPARAVDVAKQPLSTALLPEKEVPTVQSLEEVTITPPSQSVMRPQQEESLLSPKLQAALEETKAMLTIFANNIERMSPDQQAIAKDIVNEEGGKFNQIMNAIKKKKQRVTAEEEAMIITILQGIQQVLTPSPAERAIYSSSNPL